MPSATDIIIAASSVISGIDNAEAQLHLRELVGKLEEVDAEVKTLKLENEALASKLKRRKDLERVSGSYFIIEPDGTRTGPLCPRCYEDDNVVQLLLETRSGARCTGCGREYAGVTSPWRQYRGMAR
jgi:hypothetical protein